MPDEIQAPATSVVIYASPLRRLGAMLYDSLLCAAVLMIAAVPFLSFNGEDHQLHGAVLYLQRIWLLFVLVWFFVYFWTYKGKTLGMQAWRLVIETTDSQPPCFRAALLRIMWASVPWLPSYIVLSIESIYHNATLVKFGTACLMLVVVNYLTAYLDPQRRALHDRFLKTRIVHRRT